LSAGSPWRLGQGAWRAAVFEVIYAALRSGVSLLGGGFLWRFSAAGASGRVVYPSLHVYVGLQLASVGLGVLPVFVCLAPLG